MPEASSATSVELRVPADGAYVSVVRTLTAGLAARLDFTLEDVEDLRIAVSEALSMVLEQADHGAELVCGFELQPARLDVTITARSAAPRPPSEDSFGWQVLTTLTTQAAITADPGTFAVRLVATSTFEHAPA